MSDLNEIFSRDPRSYSASDLETIVAELRTRRHLYTLGNKTAGTTKPAKAKAIDQLDVNKIGGIKL